MIFKEIPLLPTQFYLDFWVIGDKDEAAVLFSQRYGASVEYYKNWLTPYQVCTIIATPESPLKGEKRIVMNISEMNDLVIVHEIVHVMFHFQKACQVEICNKSQQWVSYMHEYIFDEIKKAK